VDSLRHLCVLGVSAVNVFARELTAEFAEVAQRKTNIRLLPEIVPLTVKGSSLYPAPQIV
jgi:hypothetical protein